MRLCRPHRPGGLVRPAPALRLAWRGCLALACATAPLAGCVGGAVGTGSVRGPFGPPLPPGGEGTPGVSLDFVLAGLALGLALGFALGMAWPAWRRRRAERAARRQGFKAPGAMCLPGDLNRLRAALGLLESLLLDWRGRTKAKSREPSDELDGGQSQASGQDKPGGAPPRPRRVG